MKKFHVIYKTPMIDNMVIEAETFDNEDGVLRFFSVASSVEPSAMFARGEWVMVKSMETADIGG